jgi:hypothetical protein
MIIEEKQTVNIEACKSYAWVHISCALWIPQVLIADYQRKDDIKSKIYFNYSRFFG